MSKRTKSVVASVDGGSIPVSSAYILQRDPVCPECGLDARRPKCFWELASLCPRHEVLRKWKSDQNAKQASEDERVEKAWKQHQAFLPNTH
jgi:hypothetical protein